MNISELISNLSRGKGVSESEIKDVSEQLELLVSDEKLLKRVSHDDLYDLTLALSKADAKDSSHLLEKLLPFSDSITKSLLIKTLYEQWGKTDEAMGDLINWSTEENDEVKEASISALICYVAKFVPDSSRVKDIDKLDIDITANLNAAVNAIIESDSEFLKSDYFLDPFLKYFPNEQDPLQYLTSIKSALS